jgi:1,2-diacylglycerol 3-alpha-glucosyltransferase
MIMTLKADMKADSATLIVLGSPTNPLLERAYRLFFFLDRRAIGKASVMLSGYDRVISHFYPMNLVAAEAKRRYGLRYVAFNHGIAFSSLFTSPAERIYMNLFKRFFYNSLKPADEVCSVSKFLANELEAETGIKSRVVYNKIDSTRFHAGVAGGKEIRAKHNLGTSPVVLFTGRLSPHKGVHLLLQAFMLAKKKLPGLKLLIAGKPTFKAYYDQLKSMADESVIFAGYVPDELLPAYYAACSVYATASLWEGFDLPIVEAQACGKKVVAFDLCSHPEVVKSGILVASRDVNAFAKAILRLLNEK